MSVFNKLGEELIKMVLGAERKRLGEEVIYVVDTELHDLLNETITVLKNIETHLASGSDEELEEKGED